MREHLNQLKEEMRDTVPGMLITISVPETTLFREEPIIRDTIIRISDKTETQRKIEEATTTHLIYRDNNNLPFHMHLVHGNWSTDQ